MTDFQMIYEQYFQDVFKYSLALCRDEHTAEEITQQTFFKALEHIDSFRGECKLFVWLCQIAKNTYLKGIEKSKKSVDKEIELLADTAIEDQLVQNETAFQIHRIIHQLSEPYKEVFTLRTFSELSFKQIGDLFGKSESWARVTYHRAKLKIREEIK